MKLYSFFIFITAAIFLAGCGDNKDTTNEKQETKISSSKKEEPASNPSLQGDEIIGEWEQEYTCYDKNGNYKLEPEEKKPSNTRLGFDWFRFNADGSCLRDKDVQFEGSYSIQEKNGTKNLIIKGGDNIRYSIEELTGKELILGSNGAFIVFKRIK